jgi:hypothetical protein
MSHTLMYELDHNKKRLEYYMQMKAKNAGALNSADKWIDIYSERVKKLEKQAVKAGIKVDATVPNTQTAPTAVKQQMLQ